MASNTAPSVSTAVLGRPSDPLATLDKFRQENQAQAAASAKATAAAKKARDDAYSNIDDIDPDAKYEPLQDLFTQNVNSQRSWVTDAYVKGIDPSTNRKFSDELKTRQDVLKLQAKKGANLKESITTSEKAINENIFLDDEFYKKEFRNIYTNEDGTVKQYNEWNLKDVDAVANNLGGYRHLDAFADLAGSYGEATKWAALEYERGGQKKTQGEIEANIWQTETLPSGEVVYSKDENGDHIPSLKTKQSQGWFRTKDKYLDMKIKAELQEQGLEDTPANVEPIMNRYAVESGVKPKESQTTNITTKDQDDGGGDPKKVNNRYKIDSILSSVFEGDSENVTAMSNDLSDLKVTQRNSTDKLPWIEGAKGTREVVVSYPKWAKEGTVGFEEWVRKDNVDRTIVLDSKAKYKELAGLLTDMINQKKLASEKVDVAEVLQSLESQYGDRLKKPSSKDAHTNVKHKPVMQGNTQGKENKGVPTMNWAE